MKILEQVPETLKAAPTVSVGGLTLWGIYLNEWVMILTAVWTIYLIIDKTPTIVKRLAAFLRWLRKE